jgi:hypothetical protein
VAFFLMSAAAKLDALSFAHVVSSVVDNN